MRKHLKAAGHGFKHFFAEQGNHQSIKSRIRQFKKGPKNTFAYVDTSAAIGLFILVKHSPIGLGKNLYNSIRTGVWKYQDMKLAQERVDDLADELGLSDDGRKKMHKILRKGTDSEILSDSDAEKLRGAFTDFAMEAGMCVNFGADD